MAFAYVDSLPALIKEGGSRGIGTLRFGPPLSYVARPQFIYFVQFAEYCRRTRVRGH